MLLREIDDFRKKPSTSELVDWIRVLIASDTPADSHLQRNALYRRAAEEGSRSRLLHE